MKWVLLALAILLLLALLIVLVGLLLPRGHTASRQARIRASPEAVFALMTDFAAGPTWRTNLGKMVMLSPREGKRAFKEIGESGEMTYVIEEQTPPQRLVTRIVDQPAFGGTWTFELSPESEGTQVAITERGEVYNPVFRFLSRFFFSPTATMERYLEDLKRKAESR